jgi:hypothetical protein
MAEGSALAPDSSVPKNILTNVATDGRLSVAGRGQWSDGMDGTDGRPSHNYPVVRNVRENCPVYMVTSRKSPGNLPDNSVRAPKNPGR